MNYIAMVIEAENEILGEDLTEVFEHKGVECSIFRPDSESHLFGYIHLPWDSLTEDQQDLMEEHSHSGITWKSGRTFGFDCGHFGDYTPKNDLIISGVYRTLEYVRETLENMVDQLQLSVEGKKVSELEIKLLSENATMPVRANPEDSGLDLYVSETIEIPPHTTMLVKTDVAINLPYGYEGQVRPRSGKSLKSKLRVALGTIDYTYHKELGIITDNIAGYPITIEKGERLAQLVVAPVVYIHTKEVQSFESESARGGFGSTGF